MAAYSTYRVRCIVWVRRMLSLMSMNKRAVSEAPFIIFRTGRRLLALELTWGLGVMVVTN